MIELGRLCMKTAGRDAGCTCVVIDIIDNKFVMIDGETRRRKCNVAHLEPLETVIKITKNAVHADIKKEFDKLGLKVKETKPKLDKPAKPVKKRGTKAKKDAKPAKKAKEKVKKEKKAPVKKDTKKKTPAKKKEADKK